MCLIAIAWRASERWPLVIAANRDEEHARPSLPADEWQDLHGVYGGRDLRAGGSWLAVSGGGRLAAVTNVRNPTRRSGALSRGQLVHDFMARPAPARQALGELAGARTQDYGPFNLLLGDGAELVVASNQPDFHWSALEPGVHGLSNGPYGISWPKTRRLERALQDWLAAACGAQQSGFGAGETLLAALADERPATDEELPDTGVGLEMERRLSPPFIRSAMYGTRASTVFMQRADGQGLLLERSFGPAGVVLGDRRIEFTAAAVSS